MQKYCHLVCFPPQQAAANLGTIISAGKSGSNGFRKDGRLGAKRLDGRPYG
jgi:hypothetical protein